MCGAIAQSTAKANAELAELVVKRRLRSCRAQALGRVECRHPSAKVSLLRSATVYQDSEEETYCSSRPNHLPRIVADIVVVGPRGDATITAAFSIECFTG